MTHAAIVGWGTCMPPAVLGNDDLARIVDTSDEWIVARTGIRERRVSHVPALQLAIVAAKRALACAGMRAIDVDLIVYGSCSNDEQIPNTASALQYALGADDAGAMDINTACTSFLYGLSSASALVRTGAVKTALVIGVEVISPWLDWHNRDVAVLFGDGAAAMVLEASEEPLGVLAESLGCDARARGSLRVRGTGLAYGRGNVRYGDTIWDFDGQDIFKRAVHGMVKASQEVLRRTGRSVDDIDVCIPHQANLRIIEAVGKHLGIEASKVFLTVQRYGNMSAATVPVALVDAVSEGRVAPGSLILTPAFGGGLTWCSHVIRWGERVAPREASDATLPECDRSALELVRSYMAAREPAGRSTEGLMAPQLVDGGLQRTGLAAGKPKTRVEK